MTDIGYMQKAIELAACGSGWVNPNPLVGAVIVKDGCIVGEGFHERFGQPHAEQNAIAAAGNKVEGSTLYVTLEPCCHFGKTPPCTETIIERKIAKVVVGSLDPNPQVAGKGILRLQEAGIEVISGFMKQECDQLNRIFFHYIQTKTPYVLMKYAMTLDGKIATCTGASKWITGEEARQDVHKLRGRYAAIMVGIGTVLADDPLLNCRVEGGHSPLRIVCDSRLSIPLESQIVQTASQQATVIATTKTSAFHNTEKAALLEEAGCTVLAVPPSVATDASGENRIDLKHLMAALGERAIDSVLIEGGSALHGAALNANIVNAVRCYIAPKLFGGHNAPSPVGGLGFELPENAPCLERVTMEQFGEDFCFEGEFPRSEVK